jgi:hypothetical protein
VASAHANRYPSNEALHRGTSSAWKNLTEIQEVISNRNLVSILQPRWLADTGLLMIFGSTLWPMMLYFIRLFQHLS